MDSHMECFKIVRIWLYNNLSDYETKYIAEIEAPLLPCGGLNLHNLPNLFQKNGDFEVCL